MAVSKFYSTLTQPKGSKVKYLNFAIRQLSIFFAENLHAGRGAIYLKHIKQDLRLKAWDGLRGWGQGQNFFLSNTYVVGTQKKKVKYLNFAIRQLSIFLAENLHAGRGAIYLKHIKQDLRLKAWDGLRGWGQGQNFFLSNTYVVGTQKNCLD